MAYDSLGVAYSNLGQGIKGAENIRTAYELREREKFYIESSYFHNATGNLEKTRQNNELWADTYPRDWVPKNDLGVTYSLLGQYEKSLAVFREPSVSTRAV